MLSKHIFPCTYIRMSRFLQLGCLELDWIVSRVKASAR